MKSKKLSVSTLAVIGICSTIVVQLLAYFQWMPIFVEVTESFLKTQLSYLLMSITFGLLLVLLENKNQILFGGIGAALLGTFMILSGMTVMGDISPMPLIVSEILNIVFTITSILAALTLFYELFGKTDDKEIGEDDCKHDCSDWSEAGPSPLVDNDDDDNVIRTGPEA